MIRTSSRLARRLRRAALLMGALMLSLGLAGRGPARGQAADEPALTVPVPDYPEPAQNAWDDYLRAFELLPTGDEAAVMPRELMAEGRSGPRLSWEALEPYQPTLAALREGLPKECLVPPPPPLLQDPTGSVRHNLQFREWTLLLCVEGWLHEQDGDYRAALLGSYLDALKLSQDWARGSGVIGAFTGAACEAEALGQIRTSLAAGQADEAALRELVARLVAFEQHEVPLADTLAWDYQRDRQMLDDVLQDEDSLTDLFGPDGPDRQARVEREAAAARQFMAEHWAQAIALSRLPYRFAGQTELPEPPPGPLADIVPTLPPTLYAAAITRHTAALRATTILAALELYRVGHGGYPEALADLVPGCLARLPLDPYSDEPFCYRRDGEGYLLYSVGPNLTDDGGVPPVERDDLPVEGDLLFDLSH